MTQITAKLIERRKASTGLLDSLPDDLHPVLRRVYAARAVDPGALDTSLAAMIPVSRLEGCDAAAERLALARANGQRVLVLGDFDADGATATALVISCLRAFGFTDSAYMVPDRFRFGYGLSPA
ncbi:MAG: single-stranded-DNA-specific exonuclease RecJ, partial [Gammaproteobacteria bacterium]|nr:single-stranded-DNA-specific exonuclease RecJ [Gammaproteobacteria bacterium]